ATVSSRLTVYWRDTGVRVQGEASVDSADITLRALPANAVARNDDIVQEGDQAESTLPLDLDVSIDLGGATHLAGFGLDAQLEGDLRLRQTPTSELQGFGEVRAIDATYKAYGQSLTVARGVLRFDGPLERPDLDIRAIRDVEEVRVGVDITGPPTGLQSSLFSQPDLPEVDILSLLLTGRRLDNASASEGDALSNAAITLGLKRAFAVSGAIRDTLGLDTLTVAGGGSEGRVLAGKQLSERLYLQYAYGVFDQVSSVLLRLQINSRLTLESTTGDEQSVDLIYRVGNTGN
ncbi:MAG: translocation/assembly module TamB domain-containing protein, partial [Pseudomonadota bacterium]